MKKVNVIVIQVFFILCFHSKAATAFLQKPEISLLNKNTIIIDFRAVNDYKKQHIRSSVNLPFDLLWQAFVNNRADFFSCLAAMGIVPTKNIIIVNYDNNQNRLISDVAFAYALVYGGFKNVRILEGGIEGWLKKGFTVYSIGDEVYPQYWNFIYDETIFYKPPIRKDAKKRKKVIALNLDNDTLKKSNFTQISFSIDLLFNDGMLKTVDEIKELLKGLKLNNENVLIIYPDLKKESYALAFLLKYYVGFSDVFILKGGVLNDKKK